MSFLFPLAWWLGLLSLPVIALYLLKTRQRRRAVSTLLFWQQLKPKIENSPLWRKLRRWLSLLLQLVVLLLIIFALAQPAFEWERATPRRVVVVLDPSASMQTQQPKRWLAALQAVRSSIDRLRLQDEMAVVTAENPPRILSGWTASKRALRAALELAAPLPTGTDPSEALELAQQLTALRDNAHIEVFSDAVWPSIAAGQLPEGAAVMGVEGELPANAGLTLFAVRRSPVSPGDWQLDAEVFVTKPFSGTLELRKDGVAMDLVEISAAPGKPWRKSWSGETEGAAIFEAVLSPMDGDRLAEDNRAQCKLSELTPLKVLVVGLQDPYLTAVLGAIPLVQWTEQAQWPENLPEDVDLIIAGGAVLPEVLPDTALLLMDPQRNGFWGTREGNIRDVPISEVQRPALFLRNTGLSQVAVEEAGNWTPAPGSDVAAASLGRPLVFGRWDRAPRWLVLGFDPTRSDLPLRTAFPVLMGNLLQSLREDAGPGNSAALLPGRVESELQPLVPASESVVRKSVLPVLPGWWLFLLGALAVVTAEWFLFNRRITD